MHNLNLEGYSIVFKCWKIREMAAKQINKYWKHSLIDYKLDMDRKITVMMMMVNYIMMI